MQMSAYLSGESLDKFCQAKRINRLIGAMPSLWFKPVAPQSAALLLDNSKRLAVKFLNLKRVKQHADLVKSLAASLAKLGLQDLSEKLTLALYG